MKIKENFALIAIMIFLAALTRLIPHYPNFTAVGAIALFGGAYLSRKWALLIPLAALFVSDLFLNNLVYAQVYPENYSGFMFFDADSIWIYGAFILIVLLGYRFIKRIKIVTIAATTVSASALFFIVTNFGVWAGSMMYPKSFAGLMACYQAAVPFFWNTFAGDVFFVAVLFGGYELVLALRRKWALQKVEA
jgi:hypothetical protein